MQFGLGLLLGGATATIATWVTVASKDKIIADLYESLVEWTELADNIHLGERGLYERSIEVLNRAQGR